MRGLRGAGALVTAVLCTASFLVMATAPEVSAATGGGAVTWLLSSDTPGFDPKFGSQYQGANAEMLSVYDSLIGIDPVTQRVMPRLAKTVQSTDDAKTWTITLRPGLRFTDGTPLNAAAVVTNWDRLALPATAAVGGARSILAAPTTYVAADDVTVRITFPYSRGSFASDLAGVSNNGIGMIASPTAMAKYGAQYGSSPETTVGAGSFKLQEWLRNDHITVVRNDGYWDEPRPYLDRITFKAVPDLTVKADAVLAGQADLALFPVAGPDTKRATAALPSYGEPAPFNLSIWFNASRPPFDDLRVRKALVLAMDPKDLNLKAAAGEASMVSTWFPKSSPLVDPAVVQRTNDLKAAQKLLDAYVAQHGDVSVPLLVPTSTATWGTALMQQWSRLKGITFTADAQPPTVTAAKGATGDFSAWVTANTPLNGAYVEAFYTVFHTGETGNVTKYSDPTMDALLDAGRGATTVPARRQALGKITKRLVDQSVFALLNYFTPVSALSKSVKNVKPWSNSSPDLTQLRAR
jgi:ABC-type transport system substrate-binding protein